MSQEKNRYKATIAGKSYTIIGKETKEHMDIVMDVVNQQLEEILQYSPQMTEEQSAILLAVNTVSDQIKKQEQILNLTQKLNELNEKLSGLEKNAEHTAELEARLNRITEMEQQAQKVLQEKGDAAQVTSHIEAQKIINQQVKEKIQQNQEKSNEKGS